MCSGKTVPMVTFIFFLLILFLVPSAHAIAPLWTYSTQDNEILGLTISSDSSSIAVGAGKIWLFSKKGDLRSKEPYGDSLVITPDGLHLLSSYSSFIYYFDRNGGSNKTDFSYVKKWENNLPDIVRSIDISDDGKIIVVSVRGQGTYIYSSSGNMIGSNKKNSAIVRVSPNGQKILGISESGLYQFSKTGKSYLFDDVTVGSEPDVLETTSSGSTIIFNDDQRILCVNAFNGTQQWKTRATADVTSLAIAPKGSEILVGTSNGNVDLFDEHGNRSWTYISNPGDKQNARITNVATSKDGSVSAAGSSDGKIFTLNSKGEVIWSYLANDQISHIAVSADGSLVVATGKNTVYAFSSAAQSAPKVQPAASSKTPVNQQSVTSVPVNSSTQKSETRDPATPELTAVPTEYSVIRTSTQSPLWCIIPLGAIVVALLMVMRKR